LALDFEVKEQALPVSRGVSDIDRAYKQIRDAILLGLPGTKPTCIGAVFPGLLGVSVVSKRPVGAAKVNTRYYCTGTKTWHRNKKDCEKTCKSKPPRKKKNRTAASDLQPAGASFSCEPNVKVKIKYRVERDYALTVRMIVMEWLVTLGKPGARKLVKSWNERIAAHEREHVNDVREIARRSLPNLMNYDITGEGGSESEARDDAEKQLLYKISEDDFDIRRIFGNAIERKADLLHLTESSLPLPARSDLR